MSKYVDPDLKVTQSECDKCTAEKRDLSRAEYEAFKQVMAAASCLYRAEAALTERIKTIPNGKKLLACGRGLIFKLYHELLLTFPTKRLAALQSEQKHLSLYIRTDGAAPYNVDEDDNMFIPKKTLNALADFACRMECDFCDKCGKEARKCKLRKTLADTFMYEVPETVGSDGHCIFAGYTFEDGDALE